MGFNTQKLAGGTVGVSQDSSDFLSHWRFDATTGRLIADKPIETTLSSLFLGEHITLTSSGSGVLFSNNSTGVHWQPDMRGIKDQSVVANRDSTGIIKACTRRYQDFVTAEVNGPVDLATTVPALRQYTTTGSATFFGLTIKVGEAIAPTDKLEYKVFFGVDNTGIQVYSQSITGLTRAAGDDLLWEFNNPLDVDISVGSIFTEIVKNRTSQLLVKAGTLNPTEMYCNLQLRLYSNETLATTLDLHDPDKIISPDGLKNLTITDTTLKYNDGMPRFEFDGVDGKIFSAGSSSQYLKVNSSSVGFVMDGSNALHITSTAAKLTSKDGNNYIRLKNASAKIQQDGIEKLWMDNTVTRLSGNFGVIGASVSITGNDTIIDDGTWNRIGVTAVTTILVSPDGANNTIIDNLGIRHAFGPNDRIDVDAATTSLLSPNNLESLTIDDTGAFYNTKQLLTVSSGVKQPVSRSSIDNGVARFDGTDGSIIQSSSVKITDNDILEFDNSRFITVNITTGQNEDNMVGPLLADLWVVVPADVTRFTVRDLNNNIGAFVVRIIFIDGTDELTLTRGHDNIEVYKINNEWYYYNIRTSIGGKVTT